MNEYKLIETANGYDLEQTVQNFLNQGWKLHGPLIVTADPPGNGTYQCLWYRQVVVRGPNT